VPQIPVPTTKTMIQPTLEPLALARHQPTPKAEETTVLATDAAPSNDGLKWRKYGRKQLRNGGIPRDYYRCTVAGCNAKKQVEKTTDQTGKTVYNTTYVGVHTHDTPKFTRYIVHSQEELIQRVMLSFAEMVNLLFFRLNSRDLKGEKAR
jgi:hypothetical protein